MLWLKHFFHPSCPQPTPGSLSSCILTITLWWSKAFPNPEQLPGISKGYCCQAPSLSQNRELEPLKQQVVPRCVRLILKSPKPELLSLITRTTTGEPESVSVSQLFGACRLSLIFYKGSSIASVSWTETLRVVGKILSSPELWQSSLCQPHQGCHGWSIACSEHPDAVLWLS